MEGGGEVSLEGARQLQQLLAGGVVDEQGGGAEQFFPEAGIAQEFFRIGLKDSGCRGTTAASRRRTFRQLLSRAGLRPLGYTFLISSLNPRSQQSEGGGASDQIAQPAGKVTRRFIAGQQNQPRLGAELAGAQGDGSMQAGGDLLAALAHSTGKNEYRIHTAHFRKHGDRLGTGSSCLTQSIAAGARAGEGDGLDGGVLDESGSNFETSIKEQRKYALGKRVLAHSLEHGAADQLGSSRMGGMGFDDDRIAGGKGGGSIAAGDGKGDGEIAGSKDGDGAERAQHGAHVRPGQGLALGQGRVNAGAHPGTFFHQVSKQAQLIAGTRGLALKTEDGQSGFPRGARHQGLGNFFNIFCYRAQKRSPGLARQAAVNGKSVGGKARGHIQFVASRGMIGRGQLPAVGGIERVKLPAPPGGDAGAQQRQSLQLAAGQSGGFIGHRSLAWLECGSRRDGWRARGG